MYQVLAISFAFLVVSSWTASRMLDEVGRRCQGKEESKRRCQYMWNLVLGDESLRSTVVYLVLIIIKSLQIQNMATFLWQILLLLTKERSQVESDATDLELCDSGAAGGGCDTQTDPMSHVTPNTVPGHQHTNIFCHCCRIKYFLRHDQLSRHLTSY